MTGGSLRAAPMGAVRLCNEGHGDVTVSGGSAGASSGGPEASGGSLAGAARVADPE
jgi:hypothetical protein